MKWNNPCCCRLGVGGLSPAPLLFEVSCCQTVHGGVASAFALTREPIIDATLHLATRALVALESFAVVFNAGFAQEIWSILLSLPQESSDKFQRLAVIRSWLLEWTGEHQRMSCDIREWPLNAESHSNCNCWAEMAQGIWPQCGSLGGLKGVLDMQTVFKPTPPL